MLYFIYHPKNGNLNNDCKPVDYEYVCIVEADNLDNAFTQSQNDFNPEYAELGVRSTCVGDMISVCNTNYIVKPVGFEEIATEFKLNYTL